MSAEFIDTPGAVDGVRVERIVTHGTFSLDGGTWEVDNNIWVVGDDRSVIIIDAAHDAVPVIEAVAGREVVAIVLTHGHNDHHSVADELRDATGAPVLLHPDDAFLYDEHHERPADRPLAAGETIELPLAEGHLELRVLHTPGHSPGCVCLHAPQLATVFTGDTLFQGGPGATGRSFSDFDTIMESIAGQIMTLPSETLVLTGHGDSTTVGDEAPHLQEWRDRGH